MNERLEQFGLGAIRGGEGHPARAIDIAGPLAPNLLRLGGQHASLLAQLSTDGPERALSETLSAMRAAGLGAGPLEPAMEAMRRAKAAAHLVIAAADLSGVWRLD